LNTCAFVSAINMLEQGTWKQEMVVKAEEWENASSQLSKESLPPRQIWQKQSEN
jgi:hypothetical protein